MYEQGSRSLGGASSPTVPVESLGGISFFGDPINRVLLGNLVQLNAVAALTVIAWVRPRYNTAQQHVFSRWNAPAGNLSYQFTLMNEPGGQFGIYMKGGGAPAFLSAVGATVVPVYRRVKVTAVYDGSLVGNANRLKMYLSTMAADGIYPVDAQEALTFGLDNVGATLSTPAVAVNAYIGGSHENSLPFNGMLQDLRVWIGTALTEAQLRAESLFANNVAASLWYTPGRTGWVNRGSLAPAFDGTITAAGGATVSGLPV